MRNLRLTGLALLAVTALLAFAAAGCGDDDDGGDSGSADNGGSAYGGGSGGDEETDATVTETTEEETSGGGGTSAPRAEKVEIIDFTFDPDPVTIAVGGKVTWLNQDSAPHTATADDGSFDTGTLEEGKLKSETFDEAGTYAYICSIHPTMKGTLEVVE